MIAKKTVGKITKIKKNRLEKSHNYKRNGWKNKKQDV